jgi:hypothetical protein
MKNMKNVTTVNLDELRKRLLSSLTERAIRVSTLKKPHTFLKAVGTHEIERILEEEFEKLKEA